MADCTNNPPHISYQPIVDIPSARYHLIYFVTGNPGLIAYYETFLATLHELITKEQDSSDQYHIYGQSLAGFEDISLEKTRSLPYSLEEQIRFQQTCLSTKRIPSGPRKGDRYTSIILVGHSVGAYILLELINIFRSEPEYSHINIRAGILLFPTVTHIASSPSGVRISALFRISNFARRASWVAKLLISATPKSFLGWLVPFVTRMPSNSAAVTTEFLTSKMGIWQALHMAKDEMDMITEDKWDEEIWGIEHENGDQNGRVPTLIFYFGDNDHWVANHTRDALIAARGRTEEDISSSKPLMIIDKNGVDHGFCIRHSENIAEKVYAWVQNIMSEA